MSERLRSLYDTPFGRMLVGIIKLILFPVILGLVGAAAQAASGITITVGDQTIDLSVIVMLIGAFAPIMLLISALRDLGVRI